MEDISLHILDIAENSIYADASKIGISIIRDISTNKLIVKIIDNGKGMDTEMVTKSLDPFFTTKNKGFGLGLSLFSQAAEESGGKFTIYSEKDKGTEVYAEFGLNHIDRKPLGNIASTIITLIASWPDINISLEFKGENELYKFDTISFKSMINDIPINDVDILKIIKEDIFEGQKRFEESETLRVI